MESRLPALLMWTARQRGDTEVFDQSWTLTGSLFSHSELRNVIRDGVQTLNGDIPHVNAAKTKLALALAENLTASYVFCRLIFQNGLPDEYSIVTTIRARRTTKRERWYLWQIFNHAGDSQVSWAASSVDAEVPKSHLTWLKMNSWIFNKQSSTFVLQWHYYYFFTFFWHGKSSTYGGAAAVW